jgi:hypothetical protein
MAANWVAQVARKHITLRSLSKNRYPDIFTCTTHKYMDIFTRGTKDGGESHVYVLPVKHQSEVINLANSIRCNQICRLLTRTLLLDNKYYVPDKLNIPSLSKICSIKVSFWFQNYLPTLPLLKALMHQTTSVANWFLLSPFQYLSKDKNWDPTKPFP